MENSGRDILNVRMLGGFALDWGGKAVAPGVKSGDGQFAYLLQLVLHYRDKGVSREVLERALFSGRCIKDVRHAARSVIYNANRRLKEMGLPDAHCIQQREGICYWTNAVPVQEDAVEFEQLSAKAGETSDKDVRLELFLEACRCYKGEFLPGQTKVLWVAEEARRYRELYCRCVEEAAALLKEKRDYEELRRLGMQAAASSPLSNLETVTMEALVALGRYEEAGKLYGDTVDFYFRKRGLRPSPGIMELFRRLGEQMEYGYAALDDVRKELAEAEMSPGGYLCSYPVFQGIYRTVSRMTERGEQSAYLMLCMVADRKGNPLEEGEILEEVTESLKEAVVQSVRRSDAVTRYGKGQYLALLTNTTREDCAMIQKRISSCFCVGKRSMRLKYYVNVVE